MNLAGLRQSWLTAPAVPALLLLFGLIFGFAAFHIAGVTWVPMATYALYGGLLVWGAILLLLRRSLLRQWQLVDVLFLLFVALVAVSLLFLNRDAAYHAKFLPFLVLLPYGLGRLTGEADFRTFLRLLPLLGVLLLLLCAVDYVWAPAPGPLHSRIRFFGVDHSPLLIAQVIAASLLALTLALVMSPKLSRPVLGDIASLATFGMLTAALVLIAARGVLIAGTLALVAMMGAMHASWRRKLLLLGCFTVVVIGTFVMLPSQQAKFYERLVNESSGLAVDNTIAVPAGSSAFVTNPACKPFQSGMNSVAMRLILYREALDLTLRNPVLGVGAGNFGAHSCAGARSYPHSTVLQAFAELGLVGGGLLLALFAAALIGVVRALFSDKIAAPEAVLWLGLLALFGVTDQIYGSYFMAAGSCLMFGVSAGLAARCCAPSF